MNTIERIRVKVGLTKPQMMSLLEENPDNIWLKSSQALQVFTLSDEEIVQKIERRIPGSPSSLIKRAKEIEDKYDRWFTEVISRLEAVAASSPDGKMHTRDVARVLGISDFHLSQLRIRGSIKARQDSPRRFVYDLKDVLDLVRNNSNVITPTSRKTRGPLTNAFLSWSSEDAYDDKELVAVS